MIEAIVSAMQQAAAIQILDTSSDADHNRTVVTFVGTPEAVEAAAFAGIKTAAAHINLDQHTGEHPRLGAADVVPFVPIRDVTMADCVAIAQRLGQRVGEELGIPVYLYEAAATSPQRQDLAKLRSAKFQYEQLKTAIATDPARVPDYGPAALGPAGASVIGARPPLVAFNVYLNTSDVEIAKKIARTVRHSNGGLAFVKGAGFLVEGQAQVSMNLTNYQQTPVHQVVEMIRREAQRYGVMITHSELIGLAPQEFFVEAARWYLQLDRFEPDQILETRLQMAESARSALMEQEPPVPAEAARLVTAVDTRSITPVHFVNAVAEATATPGGGAVAALAGALSAALVSMVAGLTVGKKRYEAVDETMRAIVAGAADLQRKLLDAIAEDVEAFDAVMSAYKLPPNAAERDATIQRAMMHAADVPLDVARLTVEALQLVEQVARQGNKNAVTDAGTAALIGVAAVESAALNVRVNAASLTDSGATERYQNDIEALLTRARALREAILAAVEERAGLR